MRRVLFFVMAILVSMAAFSQTSGKKAQASTGVPFEIKRSVFFADGSLDEYTTSDWEPAYTHVNSEVRYSASGGMLEQVEFSYDEKDLLKTKITRNPESQLKNRVVYQYNPQNHLWRESLVEKGKTVYTYEYTYDNKGNKISRVIQNRSGVKLAETLYTYDSSSRMIKSETKDNVENSISSTTYTYNPQGKIQEERVVNGEGKVTSVTSYSWQDDREVKNELATPDGKVLLRISSEYGDNGELKKKTIENFQGESTQVLQYEYIYRPRR